MQANSKKGESYSQDNTFADSVLMMEAETDAVMGVAKHGLVPALKNHANSKSCKSKTNY